MVNASTLMVDLLVNVMTDMQRLVMEEFATMSMSVQNTKTCVEKESVRIWMVISNVSVITDSLQALMEHVKTKMNALMLKVLVGMENVQTPQVVSHAPVQRDSYLVMTANHALTFVNPTASPLSPITDVLIHLNQE
jgi:hypothetical protein